MLSMPNDKPLMESNKHPQLCFLLRQRLSISQVFALIALNSAFHFAVQLRARHASCLSGNGSSRKYEEPAQIEDHSVHFKTSGSTCIYSDLYIYIFLVSPVSMLDCPLPGALLCSS